jgi:hypothetical protein
MSGGTAGTTARSGRRSATQIRLLRGSIRSRLGGVEVFQVDKVTWTARSPLHAPKVLERAYCDCHVGQFDVDRARFKLGIGQDALKTLDHVQIADPCGNQRSLAAAQLR